MDITYLGHSAFKIVATGASPTGVKQKVSIITDPFDSKTVGIKYAANDSEIVTVSHAHPDHNAVDKVSNVKKVIEGPGEYEVSGISIIGYSTYHDTKKGEERGKNTIYVIEAEGLRLVHLGDLGHILSDDLVDEIGDVDIILIPVGGFYTIGPKEAVDIVSKLEPYFVIPMHYKTEGMNPELSDKLLGVTDFLKESGYSSETLPKFSLKKDDILDDQTTKVIVIERK